MRSGFLPVLHDNSTERNIFISSFAALMAFGDSTLCLSITDILRGNQTFSFFKKILIFLSIRLLLKEGLQCISDIFFLFQWFS